MKKFIGFTLILCTLFSSVSFGAIKQETTAKEVNANLKEIYGLDYDYFEFLSADGTQRSVDWIKSTDNKNRYLVYGSSFGKTIKWFGANQVQYFGYTNEGGIFENPYFPWNAGWDGTRIENMKLIPEPWFDPLTKDKAKPNAFNNFKSPDGMTLEDNIIKGLNEFFGNAPAKKWVPSQPSNNNILYTADAKHSSGRPWTDYVYIAQPPTYQTWGTGIVWLENGINYLSIPIAPFNFNKNITITSIKNNKEEVEKGKTYQCTINLNHTFEEDLSNVDLQFFIDGIEDTSNKQVIKLNKNTTGTATFTYTVPGDYKNKEIILTAKTNMIKETRVKEESDYTDNEKTLKIKVVDGNIDLAVTNIRYEKYPANSRVM